MAEEGRRKEEAQLALAMQQDAVRAQQLEEARALVQATLVRC